VPVLAASGGVRAPVVGNTSVLDIDTSFDNLEMNSSYFDFLTNFEKGFPEQLILLSNGFLGMFKE